MADSPYADLFTEGSSTDLSAHTPTGVIGGTWEYVGASTTTKCRSTGFVTGETSGVEWCRMDLPLPTFAPNSSLQMYADIQRNGDLGGTNFGIMFYKDNTELADEANMCMVSLERVSASLVDIKLIVHDDVPAIIQTVTLFSSFAWGSGSTQHRLEVDIEGYALTCRISDWETGANPSADVETTIDALAWAADADQVGIVVGSDGSGSKQQATAWNVAFAAVAAPAAGAPCILPANIHSTIRSTVCSPIRLLHNKLGETDS